MLPKAGKTLLLLGRPNVGKSLLFNRLTRTRDALVADEEGVTRDWQSGTLAPASAGRNPTDSVEHEEKSERFSGLAPQILDCGGVPDVIGYRVKAGVIEPSTQADITELSAETDATEPSVQAEAAEASAEADATKPSAQVEATELRTKADFIKNSGKADIAEPSAKAYPEKDTETVEDLAGRVGGMVLQMTVDADLVMFLTDGSGTLTALDMEIAKFLRQNRSGPVWHVINKTDEQNPAVYLAEHSTIGLGQPVEVSARTGHGLSALRDKLWQDFSEPQDEATVEDDPEAEDDEGRVLLLGRPNAGKSTLFNRLLGEERAVVSDLPGTTRDVVEMAVSLGKTSTKVRLLDSAGVARRFRRTTGASRLASNKSVRTLPKAQLAVVILDASAGVVEQDVRLIGEAVRCARGTLIVLNKADLLDSKEKAAISSELSRRVSFGHHLPRLFLSALKAHGIGALIKSIEQGIQEVTDELGTAWLNRLLQEAIQSHPPPSMGRYRAKLRYAHAVSLNPPRIVIYGSRCDNLPEHYRRYMEGAFRKALGMRVTRVQVEWSTTPNPYAESASKSSGRSSRRSAPNRSSGGRSSGRPGANRSADRPSGRPFYNKEKSEGGDRPAANRSYGHPSGDRPANGAERAERLGKGRSAANSSFGRSSAGRSSGGRPFGDRSFGDHPSGGRSSGGRPSGRSFSDKEGADRGRPSGSRPSGRPFYNKERSEQGGRPATNHFSGRASDRSSDRPANRSSDRPAYGAERLEKGRPSANRSFGRSSAGRSSGGRPFGDRSFGDHPSGSRSSGGRSSGRSFSDKEGAERGRSSANHSSGSRPSGRPFYNKDRSEQGGRPAANHFSGRASDRSSGRSTNYSSDRPAYGTERLEKGRPSANRSFGRSSAGRSSGGRPFGDRSFGGHPSGGHPSGRSFSDKEGRDRGRSSANHSTGRPSGGRSSGRPFYSKERSERGGRPANHSSSRSFGRSSDRPAYGTERAEKGRSSSSGRSATRGRRG